MDRLRALMALKRFSEARDICDARLQHAPNNAALLCYKSAAELELGQARAAAKSAEAAIAIAPENPLAHYALGCANFELRRLGVSAAAFQQALAQKPGWSNATIGLATTYLQTGAAHEADALLQQSELPSTPATQRLRARVAIALGNWSGALEALTLALESAPDDPNLISLYIQGLMALGRFGEARLAAASLEGKLFTAAQAALAQGDADDAAQLLRQHLRLDPANLAAGTLFPFVSNFIDGMSPTVSLAVHKKAATLLGDVETPPPAMTRSRAGRKLRVGFVSGDFQNHRTSRFLIPLLQHLDRESLFVFLYYTRTETDFHTVQYLSLSDAWRNIAGDSDRAAARRIEKDQVDVLIDCSGWRAGNRLGVFKQRPAPVQVTWLGYPSTTGLQEMDYRLTDPIADPPGAASQAWYSERLRRLPRGFLCYGGDPDDPVPPAPCLTNGYITLGSFNPLAKLSDKSVQLWSKVLRDLPSAQLVLGAEALSDTATLHKTLRKFEGFGVDPARIQHGARSYARVDIALDPTPFNGMATTCEALWMGVPVVTLLGDRHAGRIGSSLLTQLGARSWIAKDEETYRKIVLGLAADPKKLADLRQRLRPQFMSSRLADAKGFARSFEASIKAMYGPEPMIPTSNDPQNEPEAPDLSVED